MNNVSMKTTKLDELSIKELDADVKDALYESINESIIFSRAQEAIERALLIQLLRNTKKL